jgi:hypothetical protein
VIGPLEPGSAFKSTEPVEFTPPMTEAGERLTDATLNGFTVSVAVCIIPP